MPSAYYPPNDLVISMHSITHLDQQLKASSNQFDLNIQQINNTYTLSLIPIPLIIAIIFFIILIATDITLLLYDKKWKCCKSETLSKGLIYYHESIRYYMNSKESFRNLFIGSSIVILIIIQSLLIGNYFYMQGIDQSRASLSSVSNTFSVMNQDGLNMYPPSTQLSSYALQCGSGASDLYPTSALIASYNSTLSTYTNLISGIPPILNTLDSYIQQYGVYYYQIGLYTIYSVYVASFLLFLYGVYVYNILLMRGSVVWIHILTLFYILFGFALFVFLVSLSNISIFILCMKYIHVYLAYISTCIHKHSKLTLFFSLYLTIDRPC